MPRPRQQVIDALKENNYKHLSREEGLKRLGLEGDPDYDNKVFIDSIFCTMVRTYNLTGDLEILLAGCKTLVEIIEKD